MRTKPVGDQCADVTAEVLGALVVCDDQEAEQLIRAVADARRVYVAGQGRTGCVARAFAVRLMHLGLTAHVVGDQTTPPIGQGDLLIACSGSGTTRITRTIAEEAKGHGGLVAAIVGRRESPLAQVADIVAAIAELPEDMIGGHLLPMASLFEVALFLYTEVLLIRLMRRLGVTEAEMAARHANLE